jgi:hypothetical protein
VNINAGFFSVAAGVKHGVFIFWNFHSCHMAVASLKSTRPMNYFSHRPKSSPILGLSLPAFALTSCGKS